MASSYPAWTMRAYARLYFFVACAFVITGIAWFADGLLSGDMSHWYWKLLLIVGGCVWALAYWKPAIKGQGLERIRDELDHAD